MKKWSELSEKFIRDGKSDDCPVIDIHGHMGNWSGIYFPYAEPDQMIDRMDMAGVQLVVFSHHSGLASPEVMNEPAVQAVRQYPDRLKAYCTINPLYPEIVKRELDSYDKLDGIYVGIKLHGDFHDMPYDHPTYAHIWEFANEKELLVLIHTWAASGNCNGQIVRRIAEKYSRVRLIMGHSLHDDWDSAVELANDFNNVFLDLCAVLDERSGVLEKFVNEAGSEKVFFGTDIPWFGFHYYIGAVLAADITDKDRRNILYCNARRLLDLE